jgi:hypothetical protein
MVLDAIVLSLDQPYVLAIVASGMVVILAIKWETVPFCRGRRVNKPSPKFLFLPPHLPLLFDLLALAGYPLTAFPI